MIIFIIFSSKILWFQIIKSNIKHIKRNGIALASMAKWWSSSLHPGWLQVWCLTQPTWGTCGRQPKDVYLTLMFLPYINVSLPLFCSLPFYLEINGKNILTTRVSIKQKEMVCNPDLWALVPKPFPLYR